jgi:tetratricopeptide (TPR) repeat protein
MTRSYYEEAAAMYRTLDDTQGLAGALYNLSFPVVDEDGLDAGTAMLAEAIELAEECGDQAIVAGAHTALSRANFHVDPSLARDHAEKAVEGYEALGSPTGAGWAYAVLGSAANLLGDNPSAIEAFQHALDNFVRVNDLGGIGAQLGAIAVVSHQIGEETTSLYIAGAVTRLWEETGIAGVTHLDSVLKEFVTQDALASRPPDVVASFEAGRVADLETVIDAALAWSVPPSDDPQP